MCPRMFIALYMCCHHCLSHSANLASVCLLTSCLVVLPVVAAVMPLLTQQSYAWHEHNTSGGPIPWIRLVAALLLSTVTDALMRIARAGAHIVLLSYRVPVKRKVGGWRGGCGLRVCLCVRHTCCMCVCKGQQSCRDGCTLGQQHIVGR